MAARTLHRFTVTVHEEGFRLHIEDDQGEVLEMDATRDQIEVITDELDDLLAETEAADGDPDLDDADSDKA